jgi:Na+/H+ antiporter NhaB
MFFRKPSIRQLLQTVITNTEKIMSGQTDLNTAIQGIADDLTAENVVIQEVITALQAGSLTDAQAEALAVKLQGSRTTIETSTTALQGALTPPPA